MQKTFQLNYVRSNLTQIIQELIRDPKLTVHVRIRDKLVAVITGPGESITNEKEGRNNELADKQQKLGDKL